MKLSPACLSASRAEDAASSATAQPYACMRPAASSNWVNDRSFSRARCCVTWDWQSRSARSNRSCSARSSALGMSRNDSLEAGHCVIQRAHLRSCFAQGDGVCLVGLERGSVLRVGLLALLIDPIALLTKLLPQLALQIALDGAHFLPLKLQPLDR